MPDTDVVQRAREWMSAPGYRNTIVADLMAGLLAEVDRSVVEDDAEHFIVEIGTSDSEMWARCDCGWCLREELGDPQNAETPVDLFGEHMREVGQRERAASDRSEIERLRARDAEVDRLDPTVLGYAQHLADLSAALPGYWRVRSSVFGWFGIIDEEGWERGMLGLTSEWRVRWEVEIDPSRLSGEADTFGDALIEAMDALGLAAEPVSTGLAPEPEATTECRFCGEVPGSTVICPFSPYGYHEFEAAGVSPQAAPEATT